MSGAASHTVSSRCARACTRPRRSASVTSSLYSVGVSSILRRRPARDARRGRSDRADAQHVGRSPRRLRDAPKDRADAQHELLRAERLRQIVVGAERESANAVLLFATRGEHEHRHVARRVVGAKLLEHLVARRAGQHEIEHDERRALLSRCASASGPWTPSRRDSRL